MADDYKINRKRLEGIADRVRVMAGLTRKMRPAEIVDWLSRVKFMPMTAGESEFILPTFESATVARIPVVMRAGANSMVVLPEIESGAIGIKPVVTRGWANSELVLPIFESSAVGALQEE